MRLNVGSMLPAFAIVEDAAHHDSKRADALCARMKDGDVLLADRAYVALSFGKEVEMTFITNNFDWSPRAIAELYRTR